MKNSIVTALCCSPTFLIAVVTFLPVQTRGQETGSFYEKSLHYTNRGLEYWYSKDHGGEELASEIPISNLKCSGCHASTCDVCHTKEVKGKPTYSNDVPEAVCVKCHGGEDGLAFSRQNPGSELADVHIVKGMKCMDCHSAQEMHGDGTPYESAGAVGATDTTCEKCHDPAQLRKCSIDIHKGKLECAACHVRTIPSRGGYYAI